MDPQNHARVLLFFSLLGAHRLVEARALLGEMKAAGELGPRHSGHYLAQIEMHTGNYAAALTQLTQLHQDFPPYIGILVDIAICYKEIGNFPLFRQQLDIIETTLSDANINLNPDRSARYHVWLAKLLEDQGSVAKALHLLSRAGTKLTPAGPSRERAFVMTNELRLASLFQRGKRVAELYSDLNQFPTESMLPSLYLEWIHSLMLAETQLIGAKHGAIRLRTLCDSPLAVRHDREFAMADYLAMQALLSPDKSPCVPFTIEEPLDDFERLVYLHFTNARLDMDQVINCAPGMTRTERLLLLLLLRQTSDVETAVEVQTQINICIKPLDLESQKLWQQLVRTSGGSPETAVTFELFKVRVQYQGHWINTGPAVTLKSLLEMTTGREIQSTISVCTQIWGSADRSHFERLRMLIKRFNQELFDKHSLTPLFRLTKEHVICLRPFRLIQMGGNSGEPLQEAL